MAFGDNNPFDRASGEGGLSPEDAEKIARFFLRLLVFAPLVLIVLWGILTSFYTIQPEERGVLQRFGKVIDVVDPGLHFKLPFYIDTVTPVQTERVKKQEFGFRTVAAGQRTQYSQADLQDESLMLTGDLNVIDVSWVVQYRIEDPRQFLFNIRDPEQTLRDVSEAVMRRIVGNRLGSEVLTTARVDISVTAREEIQKIMREYESGIQVSTVELQDVVPPPRVQPAFNDVNVARQERERLINEAEKRRNQVIPAARGEAAQLIAQAEGYAAERVNRARGETARFNALLSEYQGAPEVTRQRLFLETVNDVLPRAGRVVVVQEDTVGPLPLLDLGGNATTRGTRE